MIQNKANAQSYAEPFDMERLCMIAERAKTGKGTTNLSDLECHVYSLMEQLIQHGKDIERKCRKDAVNELCLKCGDYKTEHLGACDGCRWKEVRHRHDD